LDKEELVIQYKENLKGNGKGIEEIKSGMGILETRDREVFKVELNK
jgi:hypothetical protein